MCFYVCFFLWSLYYYYYYFLHGMEYLVAVDMVLFEQFALIKMFRFYQIAVILLIKYNIYLRDNATKASAYIHLFVYLFVSNRCLYLPHFVFLMLFKCNSIVRVYLFLESFWCS
ncbi:hypothetical protein HPP92_016902 [Vanilla planifolia]|uniref:Uncharacterized protein n=1 Tax=Vanilla planifolia TaxID=51239 RepID=A0A835QFN3_VANPL|nr:hypothetical protein HPP92_016902 [Vanilla planifolia]